MNIGLAIVIAVAGLVIVVLGLREALRRIKETRDDTDDRN